MDKTEYIQANLAIIAEASKDPDMERKLSRYEKTLQIVLSDLDVKWVLDTKGKKLSGSAGDAVNPDDVITMDSQTWERIISDPNMAESAATSAAMGGGLLTRGDLYSHMPLLGVLYSLAKAKARLAG